MLRGINTSAAGLVSDERLQQILANNLANTETPGFKMSIGELMAYPQQQIQANNYHSTATGKTIGEMGLGVLFQEGVPLFTAGQLSQTGRALDIGISDNTAQGTYAAVQVGTGQAGAAGAPGQTAPPGQTGTGATGANAGAGAAPAVVSASGSITAGQNGRLSIGGQPLAVVNVANRPITGMYAIKNPAYTGTELVGANGKPVYDASGNPSYVFADGKGNILGAPGDKALNDAAIRVGTAEDMGLHSFLPVSFTAYDGTTGMAVTRNGHLSVNSQQQLVDAGNNPVLPIGANGQPIQNGRIVMNPAYQGTTLFNNDGSAVVDPLGNPSYFIQNTNGQRIQGGHLGLVNADITNLQLMGNGEYMVGQSLQPNTVLNYLQPGSGTMSPGKLEQSNVDTTAVMTQMLQVMASYQANQRVMQTEDQELAKAVQDVGKVNL